MSEHYARRQADYERRRQQALEEEAAAKRRAARRKVWGAGIFVSGVAAGPLMGLAERPCVAVAFVSGVLAVLCARGGRR